MQNNESELGADIDDNEKLSNFIQHIELYQHFYLRTNFRYDAVALNVLEKGFESHEASILEEFEANKHQQTMGTVAQKAHIESYIQQMKENIPAFIWPSCFLSFYATLEHSLNQMTEIVRLFQEQVIKIKEVKGMGIGQCKLYLTKVCTVDLSSMEDHWMNMDFYNKLRNIMIHSNGYLTDGSQLKQEKLERTADLVFKNDQIIVNKRFCQTFLQKMDAFFYALARCILAKYRQNESTASG